MARATSASVLIVIPCLNEAAHLDALLARLAEDPGAQRATIVIADGGSHDDSVAIAQGWRRRDDRFFVLNNSRRIQAAALNLAAAEFGDGADFIIRVDAHATYPGDYCARLLQAQAESGADCVTVAMRAVAAGKGWFERANACAQNSLLGTGGSPHRHRGVRRFVDHGHHALMRGQLFRASGGYDESFTHNEDAELDHRLRMAGARILLAGDIEIAYHPRASAVALWRQYFSFGKGRARTLRRHRLALKPRQALPLLVAPALAAAPFVVLTPWAGAPIALWALACLGYGASLGLRARELAGSGAGFPAMLMHAAWSLGFWRETLVANERSA